LGAFLLQIQQSLSDIMNQMVTRLEDIQATDKPFAHALTEIEAFTKLDDTLESLNKQYLDARLQRKELVALYGGDDAMVEIAIDMEDSAYCALQTRYIEVRQNRDMMVKAQRLMRDAEEEMKIEAEKEKSQKASEFVMKLKMMDAMRVKERRSDIGFALAAYVLLAFKLLPQISINKNFSHHAMAA
jgi:hypothetical protein